MENLTEVIERAVLERMKPEFLKEVLEPRVDKLIVETIDAALRSYSDTGKIIAAAVTEALRVESLDLPRYGELVSDMLKAQIERVVHPLVSERLAKDMEELLSLAPEEMKLSKLAERMLEENHGDDWGPAISVILEETHGSSRWLYLDVDHHYDDSEKHRCKFMLLIRQDGTIASMRFDREDYSQKKWIGTSYGVDQLLRAMMAVGTKLILDEDAVVTGRGDY